MQNPRLPIHGDTFYDWRFDIENIPRAREVTTTVKAGKETRERTTFVPGEYVIAACNGWVGRTRHRGTAKLGEKGFTEWEFLALGQQPEAWMPWPYYPKDEILEAGTKNTDADCVFCDGLTCSGECLG